MKPNDLAKLVAGLAPGADELGAGLALGAEKRAAAPRAVADAPCAWRASRPSLVSLVKPNDLAELGAGLAPGAKKRAAPRAVAAPRTVAAGAGRAAWSRSPWSAPLPSLSLLVELSAVACAVSPQCAASMRSLEVERHHRARPRPHARRTPRPCVLGVWLPAPLPTPRALPDHGAIWPLAVGVEKDLSVLDSRAGRGIPKMTNACRLT